VICSDGRPAFHKRFRRFGSSFFADHVPRGIACFAGVFTVFLLRSEQWPPAALLDKQQRVA
jgi:hypothetical protein